PACAQPVPFAAWLLQPHAVWPGPRAFVRAFLELPFREQLLPRAAWLERQLCWLPPPVRLWRARPRLPAASLEPRSSAPGRLEQPWRELRRLPAVWLQPPFSRPVPPGP